MLRRIDWRFNKNSVTLYQIGNHSGRYMHFDQSMRYRSTLAQEVKCSGVGVHSGKEASLIFKPAPFGQGFKCVFPQEMDLHWRYVHDTYRATTLKSPQGPKVSMVEHMLAACWGLGLTDLTIEIDGAECPIFDGSSFIYMQTLLEGGRKESKEETSWILLKKPLSLSKGHGSIRLTPGAPVIDVAVSLTDKCYHRHIFHAMHDDFGRDLARARTFANMTDIEALRKSGHIQGGSLASAVVLHQGHPINHGGFRMPNECARHKIIDIMGDFALLGHFFYGAFSAVNPGHSLNHQMILTMMANPDTFTIVPFSQLPLFPPARATMHL